MPPLTSTGSRRRRRTLTPYDLGRRGEGLLVTAAFVVVRERGT